MNNVYNCFGYVYSGALNAPTNNCGYFSFYGTEYALQIAAKDTSIWIRAKVTDTWLAWKAL